MNRMIHTVVAVGICALLPFLLFTTANAADWWESKQASRPTDQIDLTYSDFPGKPSQGSRVNWEDGYIEVYNEASFLHVSLMSHFPGEHAELLEALAKHPDTQTLKVVACPA